MRYINSRLAYWLIFKQFFRSTTGAQTYVKLAVLVVPGQWSQTSMESHHKPSTHHTCRYHRCPTCHCRCSHPREPASFSPASCRQIRQLSWCSSHCRSAPSPPTTHAAVSDAWRTRPLNFRTPAAPARHRPPVPCPASHSARTLQQHTVCIWGSFR